MNRRRQLFATLFLGVSLGFPSVCSASEEALLKKLVEKRILTSQEAAEIKNEVAAEEREKAMVKEKAAPAPAAVSKEEILKALPEWVRTWKWSGDLRLRYETQRQEPAVDRTRERFRLRFGFTTKPWEPLELGVRLSSGASGNPVSANQSFGSSFDKKAVFIDRAYAKYKACPWTSLIGGKMSIPFHTTYNVWDSDVTPEGVALQVAAPEEWAVRPFADFGAFQIAELSGDAGDPGLFGFQGGTEIKLPFYEAVLKSSAAYYDFTAIKGRPTSSITNAPAGNTTTNSQFQDDFNVVNLFSELSFPKILGEPVTFLADWTHNEAADDDNGAWLAGVEVGKVTEKLGSWRVFYHFRRIEPDATFGPITDSDFGGGGTNHKGHWMGLEMGLAKNVSAAISYSRTDEVEGSQNRVDTFQVDANLKY